MSLKWLPNAFTLLNLTCGSLACFYGAQGSYPIAVVLIALGGAFDLLDGAMARLLQTESPLGIQLDSLADVVTFGTAPALMLSHWASRWVLADSTTSLVVLLVPFLLPPAAGLRLARFNVQAASANTTGEFEGLPTPAMGIGLCMLPLAGADFLLRQPAMFILLILVVAALMLVSWPFLSLKGLRPSVKTHGIHGLLVLGIVLLLAISGWAAGPLGLGWYAFCSLLATARRRRTSNRGLQS